MQMVLQLVGLRILRESMAAHHLAVSVRDVGFDFSTDFHNSFERHPSRKPFPSANLYPTVSTLPRPFESLTSYS